MPSDAQLVDAVLAGDREAFSDLVRRYERAVRACALVVVRDRHTAEDVAGSFVRSYKLATLREAMLGWAFG
jgi:DNA-directed RNA polymerase specialized sigma24 family protein